MDQKLDSQDKKEVEVVKPTEKQFQQALDVLAKASPEWEDYLKKYSKNIQELIKSDMFIEGVKLQKKTQEKKPNLNSNNNNNLVLLASTATSTAPSSSSDFTPCEISTAGFLVMAVLFCVGIAGLHTTYNEGMARALLQELGVDTINGLRKLIYEFNSADGAIAKSKAIFAIAGGVYNAGGFWGIMKAVKDQMSWYDWIITGAVAVAQLIAWFATDGAAFIAECALQILGAAQLIEAGVDVYNNCGSN